MEKKPVVSLSDWLHEDGVFTVSTTVSYNDKVVMYERGIVKTEIIDGEEFTGKKPKVPYVVIELDKKTGKARTYKTVFDLSKIEPCKSGFFLVSRTRRPPRCERSFLLTFFQIFA